MTADEGTDWGVYYEDYRASMLNAYEKLSGNKLSEEFRNGYLREDDTADSAAYDAWCDQNEKQIQKIQEYLSEKDWERQYYDQLDQKQGGIVFVKTDGTSVYYKDYKSYAKANPKMVEDELEQRRPWLAVTWILKDRTVQVWRGQKRQPDQQHPHRHLHHHRPGRQEPRAGRHR
ncbi:MAG: hypothetical protein ACLUNZ_09865 [Evtepia sp.]